MCELCEFAVILAFSPVDLPNFILASGSGPVYEATLSAPATRQTAILLNLSLEQLDELHMLLRNQAGEASCRSLL